MIAEHITEVSGIRSKVLLDSGDSFVLYKRELYAYRITEGCEIPETVLHEIMSVLLPKRAKLRCMNLLKAREYTCRQLRDKLLQGGYPRTVAEEALQYVESFGYLDDERYARSFIEYQSGNRSRRRMETDLLKKGISEEVFRRAWSDWESENGEQNEYEMIQKFLEKKQYRESEADLKEKQKLFAALLRKGFPGDKIRRAMNCAEFYENV